MPSTSTPRQHFEQQIAVLVEKFNSQRAHYLSTAYNETDVRAEFIDPLFEALGWDVSNRAGHGPHDKEVIREKSEISRRSDYQFQLNGRVMFIVEAKAPHVPLDRTMAVKNARLDRPKPLPPQALSREAARAHGCRLLSQLRQGLNEQPFRLSKCRQRQGKSTPTGFCLVIDLTKLRCVLMAHFAQRWKHWARQLKTEVYAIHVAYRDPRVPWYARAVAACVVAYAFSPIDLIPDPIPILGYLDDLILIPLGIKLALLMIPTEVMAESREKARETMRQGNPVKRAAAVVIVAIWLLLAALMLAVMVRVFSR